MKRKSKSRRQLMVASRMRRKAKARVEEPNAAGKITRSKDRVYWVTKGGVVMSRQRWNS